MSLVQQSTSYWSPRFVGCSWSPTSTQWFLVFNPHSPFVVGPVEDSIARYQSSTYWPALPALEVCWSPGSCHSIYSWAYLIQILSSLALIGFPQALALDPCWTSLLNRFGFRKSLIWPPYQLTFFVSALILQPYSWDYRFNLSNLGLHFFEPLTLNLIYGNHPHIFSCLRHPFKQFFIAQQS